MRSRDLPVISYMEITNGAFYQHKQQSDRIWGDFLALCHRSQGYQEHLRPLVAWHLYRKDRRIHVSPTLDCVRPDVT